MTATRTQFTEIVSSVVIVCLIIGFTSNQFWITSNAHYEKSNVILGTDQTTSTWLPLRFDNLINNKVSGPIYPLRGFEEYFLDLGQDVSMIVAYMNCTSTFTLHIWGDNDLDVEATFPEMYNLTVVNPPEGNYMVDVSWGVLGMYNLTLSVFIGRTPTTSTPASSQISNSSSVISSSSQIISSTTTTSNSTPSSSISQTSDHFLQDLWASLIAPSITVISIAVIGVVVILFIWNHYKMGS